MPDREKVIAALHCRAYDDDFPCWKCAYYKQDEKPVARCDYRGLMDDAIALLNEQQERLDSIVCFENGDQVRTCHCPRCGDDIRFVIKGWNIVEDNLLGLKRIVERPQDIRVETDDGRIIVLKKEIPTMVLTRKEGR